MMHSNSNSNSNCCSCSCCGERQHTTTTDLDLINTLAGTRSSYNDNDNDNDNGHSMPDCIVSHRAAARCGVCVAPHGEPLRAAGRRDNESLSMTWPRLKNNRHEYFFDLGPSEKRGFKAMTLNY